MELSNRHPFTAEEIAKLERENPALSGDQEFAGICLIYESVGFVRSLNLRTDTATALEREFRAIAAWHIYRGRSETAARYERCAAAVRTVMSAELN